MSDSVLTLTNLHSGTTVAIIRDSHEVNVRKRQGKEGDKEIQIMKS